MGYWQCPKCGSNDTYQGTEIVSEYKKGKSVGFENEFGAAISQNIGGETTHNQMTVTKCRSCDTLLGEKDYFFTPDEIQQQTEAQRKQEECNREASKNFWKTANHFVAFMIVAGIGFGICGLIRYLTAGEEVQKEVRIGEHIGDTILLAALVGGVIAAIGFVFYSHRGKQIPRSRISIYIILLFITFGIILASINW